MEPTAREAAHFEDLSTMVATGDAVVVGSFESIGPGPTLPPDAGPIPISSASFKVDEVLYGAVPSTNLAMTVDAVYADPRLKGTSRDWFVTGQKLVLVVFERPDTGTYRPLNSQSIYLVAGSSGILTPAWLDPLSESIGGTPLTVFRQQVQAAAARIKSGQVRPLPPFQPQPATTP